MSKLEKNFKKLKIAQEIYRDNFLNKELIYIYEENNTIQEILISFLKTNFLHLTGIKFTDEEKELNPHEVKPRRFYDSLEENRLTIKKENFDNFTYIKLNKLPEIDKLMYEPTYIYNPAPNKGKIVTLKVDNFITENKKKQKCAMLGIQKLKSGSYVPKSFLDAIPEYKGNYIGEVLIVGYRDITAKKNEKYRACFRVENLNKVPDEIKEKFLHLENYDCISGNIIENVKFKNGENRWISEEDINKFNLKLNENTVGIIVDIKIINEEKNYIKSTIYYNVSDFENTEELEKIFINFKEN